MEEGDGVGAGAADVEAEHEGEEELLHCPVRLQLVGLGPGLCGLIKRKRTKIEKLVIVFLAPHHQPTCLHKQRDSGEVKGCQHTLTVFTLWVSCSIQGFFPLKFLVFCVVVHIMIYHLRP